MASISLSSSANALSLLPLLLAAALIPSLASASPSIDNGEELLMLGRFHGWMEAHGRSYATEEEKLRRFEIYRSNMKFIEAANQDSRMSYQLGETPFTDLTHDEFIAMYSGKGITNPSESEEMAMITTRAGPVHEGSGHGSDLLLATADEPQRRRSNLTAVPVPPSVDWRDKGVVTPAKYQDTCGSCWAFTSVATIESAQAISSGMAPPVLSEQQLVDCDQGCGGGYVDKAFKWVIRNGITTAAAYPYTNKVGQCRSGMPVAVRLRNYKMLWSKGEAAIMEAVARQPVAVLFDASDYCFQHYIRGVYDAGCSMNGVYTGKGCHTMVSALNHGLAIVGYGTKTDGTKYWIAKNSWSASWGDKGFVYLLRDSPPNGVCGLALAAYYPII